MRLRTVVVSASRNDCNVVRYRKVDGGPNFRRVRSQSEAQIDDLRAIAYRITDRLRHLKCIANPIVVKCAQRHDQRVRRKSGYDSSYHHCVTVDGRAGFKHLCWIMVET